MTSEQPAGRSDRTRRRLVWGAPVVVAGMVAAGVAIATAAPSNASPTLPKRTPAQLLTAVQTRAAQSFSGVVRETANLGLPSLPGDMSSASLSWQTFITGSHSAKVWVDGPTKQRAALLGELSEADVVHNGRNLWTYTSASNSVSHATLPAQDAASTPEPGRAYDPAEAAREALAAITPSTAVTVETSSYVAGRAAYTLVLRPKDAHSTVRKIAIAIDAAKSLPLRLQVFGAGSSPALEIGFTKISYTRPAASTFRFTTPKGATVSTDPLGTGDGGRGSARLGGARLGGSGHDGVRSHGGYRPLPSVTPAGESVQTAKPTVLGSGWTSVIEAPSSSLSGGGSFGGLLHDATTAVGTSGARLLHTALINAVLLPDGRAFVGAVTPAYLEHVAATAR